MRRYFRVRTKRTSGTKELVTREDPKTLIGWKYGLYIHVP